MRKIISLLAVSGMLFVFSSGCATRDYVKQQVDPLLDRITKLEASMQATAKTAKECCEKAGAAAEKAEDAAKRAEDAAKKAEAAAEKSKKSFELHQMK